jgi:hypothetical protein
MAMTGASAAFSTAIDRNLLIFENPAEMAGFFYCLFLFPPRATRGRDQDKKGQRAADSEPSTASLGQQSTASPACF